MAGYACVFNLFALLLAAPAVALLVLSSLTPATILIGGLCSLMACYLGALGGTLLLDALRPGPSVIIDADQVEDRRQKTKVAWAEVLHLEVRPSRIGIAGVVLATSDGRVVRGAPFRIGAHRRRGDQILIPLQFLDPPPHISAVLMVRLVEEAGGEVLRKPFWAKG